MTSNSFARGEKKHLHSFEEVDVVHPNLGKKTRAVRWQKQNKADHTGLICIPDKTLFPCQFYPGRSRTPGPSSLCLMTMCEVTCAFRNTAVFQHTLTPSGAWSLTCSWAAFLWSLEHMRGNISTGRCAGLSLGISETTKKRQEYGKRHQLELRHEHIYKCMHHTQLSLFIDPCSYCRHAPCGTFTRSGKWLLLQFQMSLHACISSLSYKGPTVWGNDNSICGTDIQARTEWDAVSVYWN